jgi:hypothetical protein
VRSRPRCHPRSVGSGNLGGLNRLSSGWGREK